HTHHHDQVLRDGRLHFGHDGLLVRGDPVADRGVNVGFIKNRARHGELRWTTSGGLSALRHFVSMNAPCFTSTQGPVARLLRCASLPCPAPEIPLVHDRCPRSTRPCHV